jgi:glycosyltransferase involved in cell wall biosynthesis
MPMTLIEMFQTDSVYKWEAASGAVGFKRVTLFKNDSEPVGSLVRGLSAVLDRCRPSVVAIPGWADAVAFGALRWCRVNGVPAVVMSESNEWDEPRQVLKEWIKRRIVKMCSAGLVGGRSHVEYLARLGMPRQNIFQGYDTVDNDYFASAAASARSKHQEFREKSNLPEHYFLASARFVEKKNLLRLLEAYARYRKVVADSGSGIRNSDLWDLVLLGDGPLRSSILDLRSSLGLDACIHLPGFKQYGELPAYYALSGAFIHASTTEQWGLVVNEAMASGLPVLVSNRCGCVQDLVQEGINGFAFNPNDVGQLAGLMGKVSAQDFPLEEYGIASARIISRWRPDEFAAGLKNAITVAIQNRCDAGTVADRFLLALLAMRGGVLKC